MTITFGGLATGLDTNALIDGLMAVERLPLTRNQQLQTDLTSAQTTLSSLLGYVSSIKTAAEDLDSASEFVSITASSDDDAVVVSATGTANPGNYTVDVVAIAQEQRDRSTGYGSSTDPRGQTGTLSVTVGGYPQVDIDVIASDSLADIAAKINNSGAHLNASVIYDGANYYIVTQGNYTGSTNAITFQETGTTLGLHGGAGTYQAAQDADFWLDGVGVGIHVTGHNNQFNDVIPGISLVLTDTTTSSANISLATDPTALETKLNTFIDAYNVAVVAGHNAAGWGETAASNEYLAGDSAIRSSLDRLGLTVSSQVSGLSGRYTMLASIGVNLTQNGTLELDSAALQSALEDDADAVGKVFIGDSALGATGIMEQIQDVVDQLTDSSNGVLQSRYDVFGERIEDLQDQELTLERRLDDYEDLLRNRFTQLEMLVSQIQAQGNALVAGLSGLSANSTSTST